MAEDQTKLTRAFMTDEETKVAAAAAMCIEKEGEGQWVDDGCYTSQGGVVRQSRIDGAGGSAIYCPVRKS
jgi:hypothetical protein